MCDGQQRVTTCLLLLAALRDAAEHLSLPCPPIASASASEPIEPIEPQPSCGADDGAHPSRSEAPSHLERAAVLRAQLVKRVHKALFTHPPSARQWFHQLVRHPGLTLALTRTLPKS